MNTKNSVYYQIFDGSSLTGKNGRYGFDTREEAVKVAKEFKADPRSQHPKMSKENVEYWQRKTYSIQRVEVKVDQLDSI